MQHARPLSPEPEDRSAEDGPTPRIRGSRLMRIRSTYLRLHPLCKHCMDRGVIRPAVEIDHVVPLHKGGPDVDGNRQGLCHDCHGMKTDDDMGYKPKGADVTGWPTDPRHPWNLKREA